MLRPEHRPFPPTEQRPFYRHTLPETDEPHRPYIQSRRFYIDLYHNETETYNDIFDLVAQYALELHAAIPEEFLRYPIMAELTTETGRYDLGCSRTGDSPQSTTASIEVSYGEDDDTTITYSYLAFPIRYVRLDAEGNAYAGDEQATAHLAEVTITNRKVVVNGRESSIENLAGDIIREAERNGFPMSEMMIGIWTADNAEVGTMQAVRYEASRLTPKYLVLVVEDYGKGGEIVRVNDQS